MNLARNLERSAAWFPDNLAVVENERGLTYGELDRQAGLVAAGLKALGLAPGDRVALCAPNSGEWLAFYFGVLKLGAVAITLSSQLSPEELRLLLGHCRPRALYASANRLAELEGFAGQAGIEKLICPGGDPDFAGLLALAGGRGLGAVERGRDDVAAVLYTGGTTGLPKGVMLSHHNINAAIHNVCYQERSTPGDRALCFLPFNHVFGQMHIMNATILSGGGLVLLPGFDLERALAAIARHGVTKLYGVPTIYVRLLQAPDLRQKLGAVRYCFSAAASMAREVVRQWKETTGLDIHESYGMTETASMVTYNHAHRHLVGSVGVPVGCTEISIRGPEGRPLPTGEAGEIWIRGANVMRGYLDNPQATAEALVDGWLRSGDIGYLDPDDYLYIVDRLKDMIITGGENVYPREVEEALHLWPTVAECAVIGLPDPEYGERVTAYLVLRAGAELDPVALKAFLKQRLSAFKVPKDYVAVDKLPTSHAGKILKRELRRMVLPPA
jgi:long-chain acyl-CoA synthetase